jgi:hypothetical protein
LAKNFKDLSEQEILALAISSEATDARIYADFAAGLNAYYPATAQIFKEMEADEDEHRRKLIEDYRRRFGEHIPLIRREDVKGFVHRKPVWIFCRCCVENKYPAAGNQDGSVSAASITTQQLSTAFTEWMKARRMCQSM